MSVILKDRKTDMVRKEITLKLLQLAHHQVTLETVDLTKRNGTALGLFLDDFC